MKQVTFRAPTIHCEGWVHSLGMAVRLVNGVVSVEGTVREKLLTVQYDPEKTLVEEIKEAVVVAGYETQELLA